MRAHTHPIMRPTAVIIGALLILAATLTATVAQEAEPAAARTLTIQVAGEGSGSVAVSPMGVSTGSAFSAGDYHTCAITSDAALLCWGANGDGQTDVPAGGYTAVAAGGQHTCAIRTDETLDCWGANFAGQSDAPAGTYTAVAAGSLHSCAIATDARIACWGDNGFEQLDSPAGSFSAITVGYAHTCAITTEGALSCWGWNAEGQTNAPAGSFTAVAAGGGYTCAIGDDAALECWGRNLEGQTDAPAGSFGTVAAGIQHACAVATDGAVACWGRNLEGQTNAPAGAFGAVAAGSWHSCAIASAGAITCWGNNDFGQTDAPAKSFLPSGGLVYPEGTAVTLTATADPGSTFAGWSGDCAGTEPTCDLTMEADRTATATFQLESQNQPPSIQPIADVVMGEGTSEIIAIVVSDPDGDALTVSVDGLPGFGSFDAAQSTITLNPGFDDAGEYGPVSVEVTDGELTDQTSFSVTVTESDTPNTPPSADAGGPYVVEEGSSVQLDGSGSTDADGTIAGYAWSPATNLDDASLAQPTFTGVDDAVENLTLTVTDDDGGSHADSLTVTVNEPPPPTPPNKLLAADGAADDYFGYSVAVSGDRIVVGAYLDDDSGTSSGSAYLFESDGAGGWSQTKLLAADGAAGRGFGSSVAIAGDRIVVGASGDDDNGSGSGSAYVFEPDGAGGWSQTKLLASDGAGSGDFDIGDRFGSSVAIAGDRVVVGAFGDNDNGRDSGSAYVFEADGAGGWSETKLLASDGAVSHFFGESVAIAGDRIVVGAPFADDNGSNSGSAYVFEPDGAGGWSETKLLASDGAASDIFGYSVAISGDRVVIGAPLDDDNGSDSGSAYVFDIAASDTTPPDITVPGDIVVEATNPDGASVEYEVTVTDDTDPAPNLACEPASGSVFPIGETEVLCTATDASGNLAQATFTVTVTLGEAAFDGLVEIVEELGLRGGTERSIVRQIENAQRDFLAGDLEGALEKLNDLVERVNGLEGRQLTEDQAAELRRNLELLIAAF